MKRLALSAALLVCATAHAEDLWQSYELARDSDPQVKSADAVRRSSAENVVVAKSALMPQIDASAGYTKSQSDGTEATFVPVEDSPGQFASRSFPSDSNNTNKNFGANANISIYDRANYTRLKAARKQAESADLSYRAAEQNLLLRVSQAYFGVLTAQNSVTSAKAEEKAVGRQLEQAEQRFNVGLTAITDVHEARARHDGAVAAAILAENQLDDSMAALTELTGKNIDSVSVVKEKIELKLPQPSDWQEWVDTAMKNSAVLASRQAQADAAAVNIETAKAARLPTVSSTASFSDRSGSRRDNLIKLTSDSSGQGGSIGISVNVPIFSGFATTARIRQAVADAERAKDDVEQERRSITRQTRNAYRAVLAGVSEVKAREQALVSARSALDATQAGFEVGTRTIVDVLLSQQVLFQAQRDYSRARHDWLVNNLRLKAVAGVIKPDDLQTVNAQLTPPSAAK